MGEQPAGPRDEAVSDSDGSGSRYAQLFEHTRDGVVEFQLVDGRPIVRRVNRSFERLFGYDPEEIHGEPLAEWTVPPNAEDREYASESLSGDGAPTTRRLTCQTADGLREFLYRSLPCSDSETVDGLVVYTDATDPAGTGQKRGLLAETSRCIGTAQTLQGGFEPALGAICEYTEWVYGEVWQPLGDDDELSFVAGHSSSPEYEPFREASRSVTFARGEGLPGRVFDSGGEEWMTDVSEVSADVFHRTDLAAAVDLHAAFAAPVLADGDVVAVLVFFLRERRATDHLLAQHVTDVAGQLGELVVRKQAEQHVRYRNDQLEKFASTLSHDLRNPLTVVLGRLDHLDVSDDQQRHVAAIERAATRMDEMITGVLQLARSNRDIDTLTPIRLASVVEDSWASVRSDGITLEMAVPDETVVNADRKRLLNVFENLLENAITHNDAPLSIRVGTLGGDGTGESLRGFFVEDDGSGIPEHLREEVLTYGYTRRPEGTGFGLAIVNEVVQAHGWSISIREGPAGGARFEIRTNDGSVAA